MSPTSHHLVPVRPTKILQPAVVALAYTQHCYCGSMARLCELAHIRPDFLLSGEVDTEAEPTGLDGLLAFG